MAEKELFLGVDGGGTKTVAVAARADGTVIGLRRGAGINYNNIGMDAARETLFAVIAPLLQGCGGDYREICIGMPALDAAADEATTRAFAGTRFDPARLDLQSDAYTALLGLSMGKPAMIVICGTGSILLLADGSGRQRVLGGWGHLLGDPGSGHALATDGLRAAIDAWEGLGPATALTDAATRYFSLDTPRRLIDRIYAPDCTPDRIAGFARSVLELAAAGDPSAIAVLRQNMTHIAREAAALLQSAPEVRLVGLYGGIFEHSADARDLFTGILDGLCPGKTVTQPNYPPELGALLHCYQKRGLLAPALLQRLEDSYAAVRQMADI